MVKKLFKFLPLLFLLYISPLYAQSIFKANPAILDNLKSILLKEKEVEQPDKWRLVFLFKVKGEYRPSLSSSKIKYDTEARVTLEELEYKDELVYKGVFCFQNHTKTFILRKSDLTPIYAHMASKKGTSHLEVFFSCQEVFFKKTVQENINQKVVKLKEIKHYYESELMPFVLVTFPFDLKGSQYFDMFYYDHYRFYRIEAQSQGVGQVKVPAGEFTTYKLKVSPTGLLSLFSKNFVWYQKKQPHFIVKGVRNIWWYLNETWELIKVDAESKE